MDNKDNHTDDNFKPYGTIAFMVLLLILTAIVWFSVYKIQIDRA
jgi:hypothetical protein